MIHRIPVRDRSPVNANSIFISRLGPNPRRSVYKTIDQRLVVHCETILVFRNLRCPFLRSAQVPTPWPGRNLLLNVICLHFTQQHRPGCAYTNIQPRDLDAAATDLRIGGRNDRVVVLVAQQRPYQLRMPNPNCAVFSRIAYVPWFRFVEKV